MKVQLNAEIEVAADAATIFDAVNDADGAPRIHAQHGQVRNSPKLSTE